MRRRQHIPILEWLEARLSPATTLAIADASVVEPGPGGSVNMTFVVTRTGDLTAPATVNYTTVAGTAQPNTDFTPTTGIANFAAGAATASIIIPVLGNGIYNRPSLTLGVHLTGSTLAGNPVTLSDHVDFGTGASPRWATIDDLNGDGKPDLAVSNINTNDISVLLNTTAPGASAPAFTPQQGFLARNSPDGVTTADINGDGRPDLIAVNSIDGANPFQMGHTVSVLLNTTSPGASAPSFASWQTFETGYHPISVAAGDIDGDGRPDLVVANFYENTMSVLLNTTPRGADIPSFAPPQVFPTGRTATRADGPLSVALADLNDDGKLDVIAGFKFGTTGAVLMNTTAPDANAVSFTAQTIPAGNISQVKTGDINGDGRPDVVCANQGSGATVLLNTTPPQSSAATFAPPGTFATGSFPTSVAVGDLNGDGKPDLVVINAGDYTLSVLQNTTTPLAATPAFAPQQTFAAAKEPLSVAVADINGDGKPDLAIANDYFAPGGPPSRNVYSVSVVLNTTPATITRGQATGTIIESDPQQVSPARSLVSVAPAALAPSGTAMVTLTARDSTGLQMAGGGLAVHFALGAASPGGTFGPVTDNQDGTYTATFTAGSVAVGSNTITATINGQAVTSALPTLTFPASPSGTMATVFPTFTWPAAAGADHYYLWVNDQSTGQVTVDLSNVTGTSWTPTQPFTVGDNYTWWAGAVLGDTTLWGDGLTFTIAPTASAPSGTVATTAPTFTWNEVTGADHYYLWVADQATGRVVVNNNALTATSFTPAPGVLTLGAGYTWWVGAVQGQTTAWNEGLTFTIAPPASSPSGMIATTLPTFTWTAVPGANAYYLWVTDQSTGQLVVNNNAVAGTSFSLSQPLALADTYMWWVGAEVGGTTAWNNGAAFTIGPKASSPRGTLVSNPPTFTWAAVTGVAQYEVYISDAATGPWADQTVAGISWTPDTPLLSGHRYQWWVRAAGGAWGDAMDFDVALPTLTGPHGFTGVVAPFTWGPVPGVSDYEIYVSDLAVGAWADQAVTGTSWTPTKTLLSGHTYRWWVRAVGSDTWSSSLDFAVTLPALVAPTSIISNLTPTFSWTGVSGVANYEVYVSDLATGQWADQTVTGTSWTPTQTLVSGHRYRWWVRALNADGAPAGSWSDPLDFQVM